MLSLFPELFTYALVAPLVLRIALGGYFILQGLRNRKEDSVAWNNLWGNLKFNSWPLAPILAKIQILIGLLIFLGLYTQFAAILALIFIWIVWRVRTRGSKIIWRDMWVEFFITAVAISLLFLGAGFLAFDLPL